MGDDYFRVQGCDIVVSDPGYTGVSLHGYQQNVRRLLAEFFQLRLWGAAAPEVMQFFSFKADAPAEYLPFRVSSQQWKIPG